MMKNKAEKSYQHKDIVRIFPNIPARSIISLCEKGLITPDYGDTTGNGVPRKYSLDNVIQIGIVREMMKWGMPCRSIKPLLDDKAKSELKANGYKTPIEANGPFSHFIINVATIKEEIIRSITGLDCGED